MTDDDDDDRQLRARRQDLAERIDRISQRASRGTARRLVQIYDGGAMPVTADHYFLAHPAVAGGDETEGTASSFTVDTDQTIVVDVLHKVPAVGDLLVAHAVGNRWIAELRSSTTFSPTIVLLACGGTGANLGAGITVSVYDHSGGTLLDSGTTNGSGSVTLSWPAPPGSGATVWVTANTSSYSARFADIARSVAFFTGTNFLAPLPATGYICSFSCPLPIKKVLSVTITDSGVSNTYTFNWTATPGPYGSWVDGFGDFISANDWTTNLGGVYGDSPDSVVCPTSFHLHYTFAIPGDPRTIDVSE